MSKFEFESFSKKSEDTLPIQEKEEIPMTTLEELKSRWDNIWDRRSISRGVPGNMSMLEDELFSAGALSKSEQSNLDKQIERERKIEFRKMGFADIFRLVVNEKVANNAREKVYNAQNMTDLVGEGKISREQYEDWLKLYGSDKTAAIETMNKELKKRCEELSELVKAPEFQDFISRLDPAYRKEGFEKRFDNAFMLYQNGDYELSLRELRYMLDSKHPFVAYGTTPLNNMLEMRRLGLIGDAEINRIFREKEKPYDDVQRNLDEKMSIFNLIRNLRGAGKLNEEEINQLIERAKTENKQKTE